MVLGASLVAAVPSIALAGPLTSIPQAGEIVFDTPVSGQSANTGGVHFVLEAGTSVKSLQIQYRTPGGQWSNISGRLLPSYDVFETTWRPPVTGSVEIQAVGYDAASNQVGTSPTESITLSPTATTYTFTRPAQSGAPLGVYVRPDGCWFAGVTGTTTGSTAPTAVDAANPDPGASTGSTGSTPTSDPSSAPTTAATTSCPVDGALPSPATVFPGGSSRTFAAPAELSAYRAFGAPSEAVIRVSDGTSSDALEASLYTQTVTAVRATKTTLPGSSNVTITASVTDQYGLPVVGVPLRLIGRAAGAATGLDQLAVSDALGKATFTGTVPGAGYPTGGYTIYADANANDRRGGGEPGYEVINGVVAFAAPGKAFYHNDKHIKNAGGAFADSAKGTRDAHARGYTWIDQDGQLSFLTKAQKTMGAARIAAPTDLVWVNAHGAPFNPTWLKKKDRFETKTWAKISTHAGLRDVARTFKQDARYGLSVEWEVKDIRPFTTPAALNAAFANLAAAAQQYYGATWADSVQVKMLSNLSGGQKFALKVLKYAHANGFTTILLARGRSTTAQIPASAQQYVTYVRGARADVYPAIPSSTQDTPVRVSVPPRRTS